MQDRAGDVVRQVGDDVVRRLDEADEVLVERVALDEAERLDALEALAQERRQAAIELDRGDLRAGRRAAPPVSRPRPGPISRTRRPGAGSASARIASRTSGSARKFCDSAWRARRPAARRVARTASGSTRTLAGAPPVAGVIGRPAAATVARRGRARRARRPRSAAPRPPRSSPRCRCTGPVAARSSGRPRASASPASRARRAAFAATPPPITIERAPISSAARIVLVARTSTTASWKPQASSATTSSGSGASGVSARPASARASVMIRRAAVLRPEKLRSYESPSHARGKTRSWRVAASAARPIAGPPG